MTYEQDFLKPAQAGNTVEYQRALDDLDRAAQQGLDRLRARETQKPDDSEILVGSYAGGVAVGSEVKIGAAGLTEAAPRWESPEQVEPPEVH